MYLTYESRDYLISHLVYSHCQTYLEAEYETQHTIRKL